MKTKLISMPLGTKYPIFAILLLEDGADAVIRKPSEAELEAGLAEWRWTGRTETGLTEKFLTEIFAEHDDFWSGETELRVVPRSEIARGPWENNSLAGSRVLAGWVANRNASIMFTLTHEGQAVQARNAELIARAKQLNAQ